MRISVRNRRGQTRFAMVLALLFVSSTAGADLRIFGYPAQEHAANAKLFPKWEGVQSRTLAAGADGPPCTPVGNLDCQFQKLKAVVARASQLPEDKRLEFVHKFVNRLTYISDNELYGMSDYWATQFQFYGNTGGDCEDYSITKFYALKLLGYDPERMRVVIVHDTNLNLDHAILVVERDGKHWVLDNNLDTVIDSARLYHLLPYFALNETHWWAFTGVPLPKRN
ncbi:MAG: transglutaminase-like cysteine peptidase [Gammaproteobacteria bacterium]|nr:transglutaminase-like cysteine peptidase [Gammaproteobacteria bacterium]MCP5136751.1 transglutaminase-like cysteine peptidase [Gammaproteobacteria bacterium]